VNAPDPALTIAMTFVAILIIGNLEQMMQWRLVQSGEWKRYFMLAVGFTIVALYYWTH
jgi:hypothetical protein